MCRIQVVVVSLVALVCAGAAVAEEVRYYEQNGVTYRETRRTVRRPVVETRLECQNRTFYYPRLQTELRDTVRTSLVPVTEYQWQTYWQPTWNPYQPAYLAQRIVPRTSWQTRTDTIRVPVLRQELVPTTVAVTVPVTSRRTVEHQVITRQAVSGTPANAGLSTAWLPDRVEIRQMPNEGSSRDPEESAWRPATRR